jgi:hypothetical membrane protein
MIDDSFDAGADTSWPDASQTGTSWSGVPWWGAVAAVAAPLLLICGLMTAAELQPPGFAAFSGMVSALAEQGAADSWVMTLTFAVVGALVMVTALALRAASLPGRLLLVVAGIAAILVAATPTHLGGSQVHAVWAGTVLAGLTLWPAFARRRGSDVPWALRPATCLRATVAFAILTLWFVVELAARSPQVGLPERTAGIVQVLWPLVVVMSCRRALVLGLATEGCGPVAHRDPGSNVSGVR